MRLSLRVSPKEAVAAEADNLEVMETRTVPETVAKEIGLDNPDKKVLAVLEALEPPNSSGHTLLMKTDDMLV